MIKNEKARKSFDVFSDVETVKEHNGYFFSVREALMIVILGSLCGLRNISQIHQWACGELVAKVLVERFRICNIPSYYWLTKLLRIIKPQSFNECFIKWVRTLLSERARTISFDGKTIRTTAKMDEYESPLHIVSAQIAELGITFGS